MRKTGMFTFIVTAILLIFIIVCFSYHAERKQEGFVSYVRALYHPRIRKTRLFVSDIANDTKNYLRTISRKLGL